VSNGAVTGKQWKCVAAAWLGWAFDGLDGTMYVLVATTLMPLLVAPGSLKEDIQIRGTLIQTFFLVGWAVGGVVFGRIGDRIGRSRTLTLTILIYALFTGLSFFATQWWHLLVFRFIAAFGIGGEWAAGSALVSEVLHRRHRSWASAMLQSGYMAGMIGASYATRALADHDPRNVFLIGVIPAFLTLWMRRAVPEPDEWCGAVRQERVPRVGELFSPGLRWTTLRTLSLTSVALTTVWAFLYFAPQALQAMPEVRAWNDSARATRYVSDMVVLFLLVNIGANFFACYLARWISYRPTFIIMLTGAFLVFFFGYRQPLTLARAPWVLSASAFFGLGVFGMFPMYIPPLFPTLLRTLGAGLTYNLGRLIAAVGTLFAGAIAARASEGGNGPATAIWWTGFIYLIGVFIALFVEEPPIDRADDVG
jgi:predicted MFS family arabinose efflux permease